MEGLDIDQPKVIRPTVGNREGVTNIMPFYFVFLICIVAGVVLSIFSIVFEQKGRKIICGISALVVFITGIGDFVNSDVPIPEIYTTNGTSLTNNAVYIKTESPLKVVYTLTPYEDPQNKGTKYTKEIPVESSMTVSAKASFLGIKWSELVSRDIVVATNGVEITEPDAPGTSIQSIQAYLIGERYFPCDKLEFSDFKVEGQTIAGETVVIEDFEFAPNVLSEGKNTIAVTYRNLECKLVQSVKPPALISIDAEYIGENLRVGDSVEASYFKVTGLYEDGSRKEMENFSVEPSVFEESGEQVITIKQNDLTVEVPVQVGEKQYIYTAVSELHTPNGSYDPTVTVRTWEESVDYSIDGKTFSSGLMLIIDNWMSGLMGNGTDFAENVQSKIYISVNQELLSKIPMDERYFDGYFVIGRDTKSSTTTAEVTILVDDEEVYRSGEITSASTNIPAFHIPTDGVEQIVIQTDAHSCGNKFNLGIAFE